jgi:sporulation protein YlmC with PRC-barrel domain
VATQQNFRPIQGQNGNQEIEDMKRSTLTGSVAACILLGLATPLLAQTPPAAGADSPASATETNATTAKPAEKCLSDLSVFNTQMQKDGYWLGGAGYGYGFPMGGYGYGSPVGGYPAANAAGYQDLRPGYEVRALMVSANILARHGQQQSCEAVLGTTRGIYKIFVADMHDGKMPTTDMRGWAQQQIAAAQPVRGKDTSYRSDALVGTDVRDPQDNALGSVEDLVISPKTGKIAYLVIGRGGIFGIDEKYVPVPWDDFNITPNANLLVLDSTKAVMEAAPRVDQDQFATHGQFDQQSQTVDAYWKAHFEIKVAN